MSRKVTAVIAMVCAGLFAFAPALGQTSMTWTGVGEANWADTASWSPSIDPNINTVNVFSSIIAGKLEVNLEGVIRDANGVQFTGTADGYNLTNGTLNVGASGILNAAGTNTISAGISGANVGISVTGGTLRLTGDSGPTSGTASVTGGATLHAGTGNALGGAAVELTGSILELATTATIEAGITGKYYAVNLGRTGDRTIDIAGDPPAYSAFATWIANNTPDLTGNMTYQLDGDDDDNGPSGVNPFADLTHSDIPTVDLGDDYVAGFWEGKIYIETAGDYTFSSQSDDGTVAFIDAEDNGLDDGDFMMDNWWYQGYNLSYPGTVTLTAGYHDALFGFFEGNGGAGFTIRYSGPDTGDSLVTIPADVLFHGDTADPHGNDVTVKAGPLSTIQINGEYTEAIGALAIEDNASVQIDGSVTTGNISMGIAGGLDANGTLSGGSLTVDTTGGTGVSIRARQDMTLTSATFDGDAARVNIITVDAGATANLGPVSDSGSAMTLRKLGSGTLNLTDTTNTFNVGSVLDLQGGTVTASISADGTGSLGGAAIILSDTEIILPHKVTAINGLAASKFAVSGANDDTLRLHLDGGAYTDPQNGETFTGQRVLSETPTERAILDSGELSFNGSSWSNQFPVTGGGDNFQAVWTGNFTPDEDGVWGFRFEWNDDRAGVYLDLNDDGVFQSGELINWESGSFVSTPALTSGTDYKMAVVFREGVGGDNIRMRYTAPSGGDIVVNPGTQTLWSHDKAVVGDYGNDVSVAAGTTTNKITASGPGVALGALTIGDAATLTLDGSVSFTGTSVTAAGSATIIPVTGVTTLGGIDDGASGGVGAFTLNIAGVDGTVVLGDTAAGGNLDDATINISGGTVMADMDPDGSSLGDAKITLGGGGNLALEVNTSTIVDPEYRYYRFTPDTLRGDPGVTMVQMSELEFINDTVALTAVDAVNDGGDNPATEGPLNIIDGDTSSKWLDRNILPIYLDYGVPTTADAYRWATANDSEDRDPIRWLIEGSDDLSNWTVLDDRTGADETITMDRETYTDTYSLGTITPIAAAYNNDVDVLSSSGISVTGPVAGQEAQLGTVTLFDDVTLDVSGDGVLRLAKLKVDDTATPADVGLTVSTDVFVSDYEEAGTVEATLTVDGTGRVIFDGSSATDDSDTTVVVVGDATVVLQMDEVVADSIYENGLPNADITLSGGTLAIIDNPADGNDLPLQNGLTIDTNGGTLAFGDAGGLGYTGALTLTVSQQLDVQGATLTLETQSGFSIDAADITGAGGLTKTGDGEANITLASYTGATTVEAGTLNIADLLDDTSEIVVNNDGTLHTLDLVDTAGDITINDAATFTADANVTASHLTVNDTATVTIAGDLTTTGASITINGGSTAVAAGKTTTTTDLTVNGGSFTAGGPVLASATVSVTGGTMTAEDNLTADQILVSGGLLETEAATVSNQTVVVSGGQYDLYGTLDSTTGDPELRIVDGGIMRMQGADAMSLLSSVLVDYDTMGGMLYIDVAQTGGFTAGGTGMVTVKGGAMLAGDMTGAVWNGAGRNVTFEQGAIYGSSAGTDPTTDDLDAMPGAPRLMGALLGNGYDPDSVVVGDDPAVITDIYMGASFGPWTLDSEFTKEVRAGDGSSDLEIGMGGRYDIWYDSDANFSTSGSVSFTGVGKLTVNDTHGGSARTLKRIGGDGQLNEEILALADNSVNAGETWVVENGQVTLATDTSLYDDSRGLTLQNAGYLDLQDRDPNGSIHVKAGGIVDIGNATGRLTENAGDRAWTWDTDSLLVFQAENVDMVAENWPTNARLVFDEEGACQKWDDTHRLLVSDGAWLIGRQGGNTAIQDENETTGDSGIMPTAGTVDGDMLTIASAGYWNTANDRWERRGFWLRDPTDLRTSDGGAMDLTVGADDDVMTVVGNNNNTRIAVPMLGEFDVDRTLLAGDVHVRSGWFNIDMSNDESVADATTDANLVRNLRIKNLYGYNGIREGERDDWGITGASVRFNTVTNFNQGGRSIDGDIVWNGATLWFENQSYYKDAIGMNPATDPDKVLADSITFASHSRVGFRTWNGTEINPWDPNDHKVEQIHIPFKVTASAQTSPWGYNLWTRNEDPAPDNNDRRLWFSDFTLEAGSVLAPRVENEARPWFTLTVEGDASLVRRDNDADYWSDTVDWFGINGATSTAGDVTLTVGEEDQSWLMLQLWGEIGDASGTITFDAVNADIRLHHGMWDYDGIGEAGHSEYLNVELGNGSYFRPYVEDPDSGDNTNYYKGTVTIHDTGRTDQDATIRMEQENREGTNAGNTYSIIERVVLEDGSILRTERNGNGMTVNNLDVQGQAKVNNNNDMSWGTITGDGYGVSELLAQCNSQWYQRGAVIDTDVHIRGTNVWRQYYGGTVADGIDEIGDAAQTITLSHGGWIEAWVEEVSGGSVNQNTLRLHSTVRIQNEDDNNPDGIIQSHEITNVGDRTAGLILDKVVTEEDATLRIRRTGEVNLQIDELQMEGDLELQVQDHNPRIGDIVAVGGGDYKLTKTWGGRLRLGGSLGVDIDFNGDDCLQLDTNSPDNYGPGFSGNGFELNGHTIDIMPGNRWMDIYAQTGPGEILLRGRIDTDADMNNAAAYIYAGRNFDEADSEWGSTATVMKIYADRGIRKYVLDNATQTMNWTLRAEEEGSRVHVRGDEYGRGGTDGVLKMPNWSMANNTTLELWNYDNIRMQAGGTMDNNATILDKTAGSGHATLLDWTGPGTLTLLGATGNVNVAGRLEVALFDPDLDGNQVIFQSGSTLANTSTGTATEIDGEFTFQAGSGIDSTGRVDFLADSTIADTGMHISLNEARFERALDLTGHNFTHINTGYVNADVQVADGVTGDKNWTVSNSTLTVGGTTSVSDASYTLNSGSVVLNMNGTGSTNATVTVLGNSTLTVDREDFYGQTGRRLSFNELNLGSGTTSLIDFAALHEYDVAFGETTVDVNGGQATVRAHTGDTVVDLGDLSFTGGGELRIDANDGTVVNLGALTGSSSTAIRFNPDTGWAKDGVLTLSSCSGTGWNGEINVVEGTLRIDDSDDLDGYPTGLNVKVGDGTPSGMPTGRHIMTDVEVNDIDLSGITTLDVRLSNTMANVVLPVGVDHEEGDYGLIGGHMILNSMTIDSSLQQSDGVGGERDVMLIGNAFRGTQWGYSRETAIYSEMAGANFAADLQIIETIEFGLADTASFGDGQDFEISGAIAEGDSVIEGAGQLPGLVNKVGAETVTLSGTNSFTGGVLVEGGTLVMADTQALGLPAAGATIAVDGATLKVTAAGADFTTGTYAGFAPVLTNGGTLEIAAADANLAAVDVTGTNRLLLSHSMSGSTAPTATLTGIVEIDPSIAAIDAAYEMGLSGTIKATEDATVANIADKGDTTFDVADGKTLTFSPAEALDDDRDWTVTAGGTAAFDGDLTGDKTITKHGLGVLELNGASNAITLVVGGSTGGTAVIGQISGVPTGGVVIHDDAIYSVDEGDHEYAEVDLATSTGVIALADHSDADLDFTGSSVSLGAYGTARPRYMGEMTPGPDGYQFGGGNGELRMMTVAVTDANATFGWDETVNGWEIPEGVVTMSDPFELDGSDVRIYMPVQYDCDEAFGDANVIVGNTGMLELESNTQNLDNLTILPGGALSGMNLTEDILNKMSGDYYLGSEFSSMTTVVDGALSRTDANLWKVGSNELQLNGTHAYASSGGRTTTVQSGVLTIQAMAGLGGTQSLVIQPGAAANLNGTGTLSAQVVLGGTLNVNADLEIAGASDALVLQPGMAGGTVQVNVLTGKTATVSGTVSEAAPAPPVTMIKTGGGELALTAHSNPLTSATQLQANMGTLSGLISDVGDSFGDAELVANGGTILLDQASLSPVAPAGAAAYWSMDEGTGTVANDTAGTNHANFGATGNSPTWNTNGLSGNAIHLDGSSYLNAGSGIVTGGDASYTLSIWANRDNTNEGFLFGQGDDGNTRKCLHAGLRDHDTVTHAWWGDDYNVDNAGLVGDTTNWHMWTFTYDDATATQRIYCDGVELGTGRNTGVNVLDNVGADLLIGTLPIDFTTGETGSRPFEGLIDEAYFYTRALDATELLDLFGSATGIFASQTNWGNDVTVLQSSAIDHAYGVDGTAVMGALAITPTTPGSPIALSLGGNISFAGNTVVTGTQDVTIDTTVANTISSLGTVTAPAGTTFTKTGVGRLDLPQVGNSFDSSNRVVVAGGTLNVEINEGIHSLGTGGTGTLSDAAVVELSGGRLRMGTDAAVHGSAFGQPIQNTDVGTPGDPGLAGSFTAEGGGVFTVTGGGSDVWTGGDHFHYVYTEIDAGGSGEYACNVTEMTSGNAWIKAGIMVRDNLDYDSAQFSTVNTWNNGASSQCRPDGASIGTCVSATSGGAFQARWVKVAWNDNIYSSYWSLDGENWTQVGTPQTLVWEDESLYVGLEVCSHDNNVLETVKFEEVNFLGGLANDSEYGTDLDITASSEIEVVGGGTIRVGQDNTLHDGATLTVLGQGSLRIPKLTLDSGVATGGITGDATVLVDNFDQSTATATIQISGSEGVVFDGLGSGNADDTTFNITGLMVVQMEEPVEGLHISALDGASYVIDGGVLAITDAAVDGNDLTLPESITVTTNGGGLAFGSAEGLGHAGPLTLTREDPISVPGGTFTFRPDEDFTIDANTIDGAGGISIDGKGTANLTNADYTGTTGAAKGTLNIADVLDVTSDINVTGGTLNTLNTINIAGGVAVSGGTMNASADIGAGTMQVSGGVLNALGGTSIAADADISGGLLDVSGGTFTANSINVTGGTARTSVDIVAGTTTIDEGGTLELAGDVEYNTGLADQTITANGTLLVSAGDSDLSNTVITGNPDEDYVYVAGLAAGTLTGTNPLDKTTPNPANGDGMDGGDGIVMGPERAKTKDWGGNTTYVYTGQIYLDSTKQYNVIESIDDEVYLVIDGTPVIDDTTWNGTSKSGLIGVPTTGWYDIDLRLCNIGGGSGYVSINPGIQYNDLGIDNTNDADHWYPEDDGTMNLFRNIQPGTQDGAITVDSGAALTVKRFENIADVTVDGTLTALEGSNVAWNTAVNGGGTLALSGTATLDTQGLTLSGGALNSGGGTVTVGKTVAIGGTTSSINLSGGQLDAHTAAGTISGDFAFNGGAATSFDTLAVSENATASVDAGADLDVANGLSVASGGKVSLNGGDSTGVASVTLDAGAVGAATLEISSGDNVNSALNITNNGSDVLVNNGATVDMSAGVISCTNVGEIWANGLRGSQFQPTADNETPVNLDDAVYYQNIERVFTGTKVDTILSMTELDGRNVILPNNIDTAGWTGGFSPGDHFVSAVAGRFFPQEAGTASYNFHWNNDDRGLMYMDVNRDGTFQASERIAGYAWNSNGSKDLTNDGIGYDFIYMAQEYGGGDGIWLGYTTPSAAEAVVNPTTQAGQWQYMVVQGLSSRIAVSESSTLSVLGISNAESLAIDAGSTLALGAFDSNCVDLQLDPAGLLDVGLSLRIKDDPDDDLASILASIDDGRGTGGWGGYEGADWIGFNWDGASGITSSAIAGNEEDWSVVAVDDGSGILIRLALFGDLDLDEDCDRDDLATLVANMGQAGGWAEGDLDGSGLVDSLDYLIMKAHLGDTFTGPTPGAGVPEPATMILLAFGGAALLARRRRNK